MQVLRCFSAMTETLSGEKRLVLLLLPLALLASYRPTPRSHVFPTSDLTITCSAAQTIMLLLGGFAIASAFTKHFIAKRVAVWVLGRVSAKPHAVLLANMFVATFASMWITNVAAPVLCFSVLDPILRTLPSGHSFGKALVLGECSWNSCGAC